MIQLCLKSNAGVRGTSNAGHTKDTWMTGNVLKSVA